MRRLLASMSMALAMSAAGAASAHDATKVIFNLSELQRHQIAAPAPSKTTTNFTAPQKSLPVGVPSGENHYRDASSIQSDDTGMEVGKRPGSSTDLGVGRTPGKGGGTTGTPNPEPGTMMLLGSGLAAGARFLRRRAGR